MSKAEQRAVEKRRSGLGQGGMARFEVLGRRSDRDFIRAVAKILAEDSDRAAELRAAVEGSIGGKPPRKGGIFLALRRSPLVGAELDLTRKPEAGREVEF